MNTCFKSIFGDSLDYEYAGNGHKMATSFYIPTLKCTKRYDRASGYFSVGSLVVVATGMAHLIHNEGSVRLIVGLHDINEDLEDVYLISQSKAQQLLNDIGEKIAKGLEETTDVFSKQRLEALAWMLVEKRLEIRVAIPKQTFLGKGNGIFHQKRLLFYDSEDNIISAIGSSNETKMAWTQNGENLVVFASWRPGNDQFIKRQQDAFEALWTDTDPDFRVYSLPEVVEKKLREKYYPNKLLTRDPDETIEPPVVDTNKLEKLVPAARFVKEVGTLRGLEHLGLGPVRLYPHQVSVMKFALDRFPHRVLIADEVGLGKTIEVGSVIKRLIEQGTAERVIILAPKNVTRQWQDEMYYHFNKKFWRLETGPKRLVAPADEETIYTEDRNPFDVPAVDLVIASWHYARGTKRSPSQLLSAEKYFDLVIVDEAHSARQMRNIRGERSPTLLNQLCMELSITSPHIILVTATPVQLNELEAWDLLRILGLGGPWAHEDSFRRYYSLLQKQDEEISEWIFAFKLASWVARNYLTNMEREELVRRIISNPNEAMNIGREIQYNGDGNEIIARLLKDKPDDLISLLIALSPIHWFMVRNNRKRLEKLNYTFPERIIKEVPVQLSLKHQKILDELNKYLSNSYGLYEYLLSKSNRGVLGFVRTVYHQRFVSSFTASYVTIKNRREFLEAILRQDEEVLLQLANKLLEDVDWDGDEYDIIEEVLSLVNNKKIRDAIEDEKTVVSDLEYHLLDYAPDRISIDDPKLSSIHQQICEITSEGRQVLVFSKYTDTVGAIIEYIERLGTLPLSNVGSYTGDGGKLFEGTRKSYKKVSKMEVRRALDEGTISVLVCSEAASEGLNLQSASAVINVDMPWNPSKVEQRIGRVDRLGQDESIVYVRNVWYPDSIEAEMYRRLFDRGEIYRLVVGPAQEIVSKGLLQAFNEGFEGERLRNLVEDTIREIENVRTDGLGLFEGRHWTGDYIPGDLLVNVLLKFVKNASLSLGLETKIENEYLTIDESKIPKPLRDWHKISLKAGNPNALTPAHPIVIWLVEQILDFENDVSIEVDHSLYVVNDHQGLGTLIDIP
ncbi:MAG: DEAD/DEAH box helicase, partial [Candidatus Heimdallarchaeaceae archaeon]